MFDSMMCWKCSESKGREGSAILVCILRKRNTFILLFTVSVFATFAMLGLTTSHHGRPLSEPAVCEEEFGNDREVDLRKIKGYQFPEMKHYSKFIFPQNYESSNTGSHKPGVPVADHVTVPTIVTGADYSHFKESLDLISNMNNGVRKAYKDMELVYFDLGLSRYQRQELELTCDCDVRTFPFDQLPSHVRLLKGYAWKPVCIQLVLNEYPFVMWMDASVRLKTENLTWFFEKIKQQGVMAGEGDNNIAARTQEQTFNFLQEPPCLYRRSEFEGTFIAVYQTQFVQDYFMKPWVSCALSVGCMVFDNLKFPTLLLRCGDFDRFYHECHRFDQSVLSILLNRLYHAEIENHKMKRYTFYKYCGKGEQWRILPEYVNDYINNRWFSGCKYG